MQQNYFFTQDYVSHFASTWARAFERYRGAGGIKYLEVGVYEGRSLLWMLENVLTHPTSEAYAIDPYDKIGPALLETKNIFLSNLAISRKKSQVHFINDFSHAALPQMQPDFFDLAYIDGNHDATAVEQDLLLTFPILKSGSILIIDDYLYKPLSTDNIIPPKIGIDRFLQSHGHCFKTLQMDYQIILQKIA